MVDQIDTIQTPAFVVNEALALRNIAAFQAHCDTAGLALRPHIKTHKSVRFAKAQLAAGAIGITCQKISEAEAMAADGIDDIFITYNILGAAKLERLRNLAARLAALSVVADNLVVVQGLARTFADAKRAVVVLVECDTGAGRCGVQAPEDAANLAIEIINSSGLTFGGLMTYPAVGGAKEAARFLREARQLLMQKSITCPVISSGGSPDMWTAATDDIVTEYRIGTYVYNDRSLVRQGACTWEDCAGHVVATVVSRPTPERAIIDAGSKVLTSDLLGFTDYGHVMGHPEISIHSLSEEHGILSIGPDTPIQIGDRIRIVPNHVCVVSNMFDDIWLEGDGKKLEQIKVTARGKVT